MEKLEITAALLSLFSTITGKKTEELLKFTQAEDGTALDAATVEANIKKLLVEKISAVKQEATNKTNG